MIYDKINFFLPTYNRVKNWKLPRFVVSAETMASTTDNIMFTFLINPDDKLTEAYLMEDRFAAKTHILYWNENKPHLGRMYNQIYRETPWQDESALVTMVGDDQEVITKDYDVKILDAINRIGGDGFVYCNDTIQGHKLCTHLFTTRSFVKKTGVPFMCELFPSYFIDTVWYRIGQGAGKMVYLPDVTIKHHHYTKDLSIKDETSDRLRALNMPFQRAYKIVDRYVEPIIERLKNG